MVIGVDADDVNGGNSGSAYVFERDGFGNWSEVQKLTASDGAVNDRFGGSVSISGDYAMIGAYGDDDSAGSAYIFDRNGAGVWSEVGKLTASDRAEFDRFGGSVLISGNTLLVGAYTDDGNGLFSGSAYTDDGNGPFSPAVRMCSISTVSSTSITETEAMARCRQQSMRQVSGDRLAVRSNAFDVDGIINLSSMPLTFIAVEPIEMGADLMLLPADGTSFVDSGDVDQAGWSSASQVHRTKR